MVLTEEKLREFIRSLLFEEILGEPDHSREDDREDPDDKDKEKDDDEETLTDTKDEAMMVGGLSGGLGPMTPVGTDARYPDTGSPSDYLSGKKKKKKRRKKKK